MTRSPGAGAVAVASGFAFVAPGTQAAAAQKRKRGHVATPSRHSESLLGRCKSNNTSSLAGSGARTHSKDTCLET